MTETLDESVSVCAVCATDIDPENSCQLSYSTDKVCDDCAYICERCDDIGTENDDWCTVNYNERWCQNCTDNNASWCDSCEEYSTDGSCYIEDRGTYWCDSCATSSAFYCEDCNEWNEMGCGSCNDSRIIHDYSYRPDPIFHSTDKNERLFFGLELEMEFGRGLTTASEYAHQLEALELAYLKHDGSLNNGFEVVTHPMSHDFYKNQATELFDVIEGLRTTHQASSWGTGRCGVHIHISRTGFNGGAHMHRFLNLVYSNQQFYEALAGRSSSRWAKFDDVDRGGNLIQDNEGHIYRTNMYRSFKEKISNGRQSDRYSAVNTQNHATLELRIFRGTTKGMTIKSHIDLAHASVEYTRVMSVKQVREGALSTDSFMTYIESHADLYPELNERMSRLVDPSVRLNGQNVSA